jgi:hypothetical protein
MYSIPAPVKAVNTITPSQLGSEVHFGGREFNRLVDRLYARDYNEEKPSPSSEVICSEEHGADCDGILSRSSSPQSPPPFQEHTVLPCFIWIANQSVDMFTSRDLLLRRAGQ